MNAFHALHFRRVLALALLAAAVVMPVRADDAKKPYAPKIAAASDEGQAAIGAMRIPEGFKVELFAAEPDVANPVVFAIDEKGRVFVAESFRQGDEGGIVDNRNHMYWLDDDLAAKTVEDRRAFMLKYRKDKLEQWTKHHDRIRLLEDTDGDGRADRSVVYYSGFNDLVDGSLAGVLSYKGDVYAACIPKLYKLRDTNNDGVADETKVLSEGYGVRVAFRGHDLHGLLIGPDGRLYFSLGDRGYHIITKEGKTLSDPGSGAVFRCELDGSNLEVVHTGLRNPQELVFDDYGNLFAGDNNSDSGDQARWVYIVEGGNSGWNMAFQYLPDRGPWNREGWWHLWDPAKSQAAFIVPPLKHIGNGPSGVTHYPGTGWGDAYRETFFMTDFKGGAGQSGVWSFKLKPRGAWFEVDQLKQFLWGTLVTDADFGYDGSFYFSDWVQGWTGEGKGRIYRLLPKEQKEAERVAEVKKLMAEGFDHRKPEELAKLLGHADRRVRMGAQFALVGQNETKHLRYAIEQKNNRLARLHGVWGMGQVIRRSNQAAEAPGLLASLFTFLGDDDVEVRAQVTRLYGESSAGSVCSFLLDRYPYGNARQTFFAAIALGKTAVAAQKPKALDTLFNMLAVNRDADPYLRHAAVMGLYYLNDADALIAKANDENRSVRLGILLALRRLGDSRVAMFLDDRDEAIVTEAARAIHDVPIEKAMPALAAVLSHRQLRDESLVRRAISAAYRLGGADQASAIAALAQRDDVSSAMRVEAMQTLIAWEGKVPRDRVLGSHLKVPARKRDEAKPAAESIALTLITSKAASEVRETAAKLIESFKLAAPGSVLVDIVRDAKQPAAVRTAALRAMGAGSHEKVSDAITASLASDQADLRKEARRWLAKLKPAEAAPVLEAVLESGRSVAAGERQGTIVALAEMKSAAGDAVLEKWLDRMIAGKAGGEIQLELLEAARTRSTPRMKLKLAAWEAALSKDDPLVGLRQLLAGGDAAVGKKVFWENTKSQCQRCHKVKAQGAGEAGPDLFDSLRKQDRAYILESILFPNRKITEGFETVLIETVDGEKITGVVRGDDGKTVTLYTPDNKKMVFNSKDIIDRRKTKSAMPEDFNKHLSERELRDLVEYLAGQK